MKSLSGNLRPDVPTHLTHVSLVLRIFPDPLQRPTPTIVSESATKLARVADLWQGAQSPLPVSKNDI